MKKLIFKLFAVCLFLLAGQGVFAQTNKEMRTLVETMNKEMMEMVVSGRYEALGKYYDPEAISLPNYRQMEKGYKLILNNNNGRKAGGYKVIEGQKTTIELFVTKEMMVDIGAYSITVTFPGIQQPKTDAGKYMNVWRLDLEGNWRIIAETWNADKSPNAPAAVKSQTPAKIESEPKK